MVRANKEFKFPSISKAIAPVLMCDSQRNLIKDLINLRSYTSGKGVVKATCVLFDWLISRLSHDSESQRHEPLRVRGCNFGI